MYWFVSVCISLYEFVWVCMSLYEFVSVCIRSYQESRPWYQMVPKNGSGSNTLWSQNVQTDSFFAEIHSKPEMDAQKTILNNRILVFIKPLHPRIHKKHYLYYIFASLYWFVSVCIGLYQFVSVCMSLYQFVSVCMSLYEFVWVCIF